MSPTDPDPPVMKTDKHTAPRRRWKEGKEDILDNLLYEDEIVGF